MCAWTTLCPLPARAARAEGALPASPVLRVALSPVPSCLVALAVQDGACAVVHGQLTLPGTLLSPPGAELGRDVCPDIPATWGFVSPVPAASPGSVSVPATPVRQADLPETSTDAHVRALAPTLQARPALTATSPGATSAELQGLLGALSPRSPGGPSRSCGDGAGSLGSASQRRGHAHARVSSHLLLGPGAGTGSSVRATEGHAGPAGRPSDSCGLPRAGPRQAAGVGALQLPPHPQAPSPRQRPQRDPGRTQQPPPGSLPHPRRRGGPQKPARPQGTGPSSEPGPRAPDPVAVTRGARG